MAKDKKGKKSSTIFGGLTGKAEKALKTRGSKIDKAVNKASGKKKKEER